MDGAAAIKTTGLAKHYGKTVALAGLDLEVPAGSITGLLGPAGAGKSTVLRLLAGLARPTAGSATVGGVSIRLGSRDVQRKVGLLVAGDPLYDWMSARELLSFAAELSGVTRTAIADRVADVLARVGLADDADARIGTLELARQRRVGLAQALIGAPEVLLLDEPLSELDPLTRAALTALIRGFAAEATVVLSSPEPGHLEGLCDRVVVLDRGDVIVSARVDALLGGIAGAAYLLELEREPSLAAAGMVARLRGEPWIRAVEIEGRLVRITVHDEARAAHELLPSVVATGLPIASFRRERPTLAAAIADARTTGTPS